MNYVGWRPVFVLFGVLSLLWAVALEPRACRRAGAAGGSRGGEGDRRRGWSDIREILRERGLWAPRSAIRRQLQFLFLPVMAALLPGEVRDFSMTSMAVCWGPRT